MPKLMKSYFENNPDAFIETKRKAQKALEKRKTNQ